MADMDDLVEKACIAWAQAGGVTYSTVGEPFKDSWRRSATAALEVVGLPALLERAEAAERERGRLIAAHQKAVSMGRQMDALYLEAIAERDALAAKVADAGERIAQAIDRLADECDPELEPIGRGDHMRTSTLRSAAAIARAALTEGYEKATIDPDRVADGVRYALKAWAKKYADDDVTAALTRSHLDDALVDGVLIALGQSQAVFPNSIDFDDLRAALTEGTEGA